MKWYPARPEAEAGRCPKCNGHPLLYGVKKIPSPLTGIVAEMITVVKCPSANGGARKRGRHRKLGYMGQRKE